jgi:hypothetical protein
VNEGDAVSVDLSQQEQELLGKVETSERALGDLQRDLQAVDAELGELAHRNHQYDVLSQICRSLDDLQQLGAGQLFWGDASSAAEPIDHLGNARSNIDAFNEEVAHVEGRRQSIAEKIGGQNETLQFLHYDLLATMEEEEKRKNEWFVEREANIVSPHNQVMPWARGCEEDDRFRRSLRSSILASIILALLVSVIDIPIPERSAVIKVPERVAKLVREERMLPKPVAEPTVPDEPVVPEESPEPELTEDESPVLAKAEQPNTREQVKSKGILAFRDSFASRSNLKSTAQLGSQARMSNAGANAVGRPERAMITSSAPGSSGGINLAAISRDVGGGGQGIDGVQIGQVASSIGGAEGADRPLSGGAFAGRTDEEIQIVFDRYKAALYRLYNRELRKNPTLRGQLTLRLTIEPGGTVSLCELQASSMKAPALAQQVVDRVRTFDFGAKEDIVAITIIYPIDFLPAA